MSDFFDNNQKPTNQDLPADETVGEVQETFEEEEESTVFSKPKEHSDKSAKSGGKKRLTSIIAAVLAVAILVGGTLAVIKLIPEMTDDETPDSIFEDIAIVDEDSKNFTSVKVKNKNGEFNFISKEITASENAKASTYWTIEGVDYSKLSSSKLSTIVSSAASVTAIREIDKPAEECGFNEPTVKVTVTSSSKDPYTFTVGSESPDNFGYYCTVEGSDKNYIISEGEFSDFIFSLLDISDTSAIPATTFTSDTSSNKAQDGSYAFFDSLTLSGTLYPEKLTIVPRAQDAETISVVPYLITTPVERYAKSDSLSGLVGLFSSTVPVTGNYALDVNDETLKLFGLDKPDAIITMTINGEAKTFKFSCVDGTSCAIVYDGATMIRKADISSFDFLNKIPEDYYFRSLFNYAINDLNSMTLKTAEEEIKFGISYTEVETVKTYHITANGKEIKADNFQTYYADFSCIQCSSFAIVDTTGPAEGTVTFEKKDGTTSVIKFFKISETEYQYSINDVMMGQITSSEYNKMVKNLKTISEGNAVS